MMLALDEGDGIDTGWGQSVGVFECVADAEAIDGEVTVSVVSPNCRSCENKGEGGWMRVEG